MAEAVKKYNLLTKAALLHDIGKVCLRTGQNFQEHSKLGAKFLEQYFNGVEKERFLNCIKYHHADNLKQARLAVDDLSYIVYEADNIAAGTDRRKNESGEYGFDKGACLETVFNVLGAESTVKNRFLLRDQNPDNPINYPLATEDIRATAAQYQSIIDNLSSNFQRAALENMMPNELLNILEATLCYVPSSTSQKEVCDISLFDHQKMTAAVAVNMLQYFEEHKVTNYKEHCFGSKNAELRNKDIFLMVSGDLSGIQNFIYTIPSDGALKNLRGRSFYLDLLLENIADELLEALGLNRSNLIYTGGGHFYMLLPNTDKAQTILAEFKKELSAWFLQNYRTVLYAELAWQPCSPNSFMNISEQPENTGTVFSKLSNTLAERKLNRYTPQELEMLFDEQSPLNQNQSGMRECAVCHTSTMTLEPYGLDRDKLVCKNCNNLFTLGSRLLSEELALAVVTETNEACLTMPGLKRQLYLLPRKQSELEKTVRTANVVRIYIKNDYKIGAKLTTHLWVGDYAAKSKDNKVLDFTELAKLSGGQNDSGIKRLGVLRADVDGLGATFMAGFYKPELADPTRYVTLSRYATLSRNLSLFFKQYVNNICRGELQGADGKKTEQFCLFGSSQQRARNLNIVYCGGDDMFIVGAWDEIIEFAVDLYRAFAKYSCNKLTFSAGIGFFQPSFPISKMADLTGNLEEIAKSMPEKNSIALFGTDRAVYELEDSNKNRHTYLWPEFVEQVCGEKLKFLQEHLQYNAQNVLQAEYKLTVGKTMLYRLLELLETDSNGRQNLARLAYTLARMEPSRTAPPSLQDCYRSWREKMYRWSKDPKDKAQLLTALNLIIYKLRATEKGE